jgi:hypothetical protein
MKLSYFTGTLLAGLLSHVHYALGDTVPTGDPTMCTPTGAGVCNLGIVTFAVAGYDGMEQNAVVYDRDCNIIGGTEGPYVGMALDSQLPYTIDFTQLSLTLQDPTLTFLYAGSEYSTNNGQFSCRSCNSGLSGGLCCQCAFNC